LSGTVTKALWVGFSVEQLCRFASHPQHPLDFSTVLLRKRLDFTDESTAQPKVDFACRGLGKISHGSLVVV